MPDEESDQVSVKVSLPPEEVEDLQKRAQALRISPARYLRQALTNQRFFEDEIAQGASVLVKAKDGEVKKVTTLNSTSRVSA
jgi:hypothetical protein